MVPEDVPVEVGAEVIAGREVAAHRDAWHGNEDHDRPVGQRQPGRPEHQRPALCPAPGVVGAPRHGRPPEQKRRHEVTDGNALQHTRDADGAELPAGIEREDQPEPEDDERPLDDLPRVPHGPARQRDRHADDEEKEREDEVGRRAAVPFGMTQRRVDVLPVAGVVDDRHPGHRQAAEGVEGRQTRWFGHAGPPRVRAMMPFSRPGGKRQLHLAGPGATTVP